MFKGKRIVLKEGDVFEARVKDRYHYFQFIYADRNYLGGELVRLFNYNSAEPMIVFDFDLLWCFGVKCHYHTMVRYGAREGFWQRVGKQLIESDFEPPTFRATNQYKALKATDWRLLKASECTFIGEIHDELRKLPISSIRQPHRLIEIIELGYDSFLSDIG